MKYWENIEPSVKYNFVRPNDADYAELNHGLPKKFLNALKSLFDILDESKTGFIKMADIEHRWREEECNSNVPKKLIECLTNVQTANGLINFERFCAGIKLCLLANQCNDQLLELKNKNNNYQMLGSTVEAENTRSAVNYSNHPINQIIANDNSKERTQTVASDEV